MSERPAAARSLHIRSLRPIVVRHPVAAFLLLVYAIIARLAFLPPTLTQPGLLPAGATVHGPRLNVQDCPWW